MSGTYRFFGPLLLPLLPSLFFDIFGGYMQEFRVCMHRIINLVHLLHSISTINLEFCINTYLWRLAIHCGRILENSSICTTRLTALTTTGVDLIYNDPEFKILLPTDCLCWFQPPSAPETLSLWARRKICPKIWTPWLRCSDLLMPCVRCVCSESEADSLHGCHLSRDTDQFPHVEIAAVWIGTPCSDVN